jgi:lipoprotein NlpD
MVKNFSRVAKVISCFTLVALAGCTRTTPPADVEYDHTISPYHVVRNGESISGIARHYHMDKMDLIRLNGLRPPYKIVIGQRLLIRPSSGSAASKSVDPFDAPASDSEVMKGDVKVTQLSPMTSQGIEEYDDMLPPSGGTDQPFEKSGAMDNDHEEILTEEEKQSKPSKLSSLPDTPQAATNYIQPVKGRIIRSYKAGKSGHDGVNIAAPKGTPVIAANNGVVAHAGNQVRGFGNLVLIRHEGGIKTVYAHLDEVRVKVGEKVHAGQKIGTVGKTGNVKEPQLHFEIRKGTTPVDPNKYVPLS